MNIDIKALRDWCAENGYDPRTNAGRNAFKAAQNGNGGTKRKNQERHVTVRTFGTDSEGTLVLFESATSVRYRDRSAHAADSVFEAETSGGLENAFCEVVESIELS